ncbi:hypothetical protein DMN91_003428 [Ooceraea biroi]|uniref:Uncharacterized protein n=1 Tax=Ooceraea biroi TaxID=2015173 RepID=A0A3L8DS16_OOCBI|nr:hypothetical protein DMN91_003428 [Ooceraea biroi]
MKVNIDVVFNRLTSSGTDSDSTATATSTEYFLSAFTKARLAERSKAPDLRSGSHLGAWVRTPHLANLFVFLNYIL